MKIAICPGSFDPCTNGHLDIISRTAKIFDKVIVAVLVNSSKKSIFTLEERVNMIKIATKNLENVEVQSFSGLLVDFVRENNASIVVKGLRAVSDYEYEFQLALTNKTLNSSIETIFMHTSAEYMYLSSSVVREIARYNGNLKGLIPDELIPIVKKRFKSVSDNK